MFIANQLSFFVALESHGEQPWESTPPAAANHFR
jgi:hypothetical protein